MADDDFDPETEAPWDLARYSREYRRALQEIERLKALASFERDRSMRAGELVMRYARACAPPVNGVYHFQHGEPPHRREQCTDAKCWTESKRPEGGTIRMHLGVDVMLAWVYPQPAAVFTQAAADE